MLVAVVSGYAAIRHARQMMQEGIELSDGGGWTALFLVEFAACFAGVGVALA
jgi:hypothetical protein